MTQQALSGLENVDFIVNEEHGMLMHEGGSPRSSGTAITRVPIKLRAMLRKAEKPPEFRYLKPAGEIGLELRSPDFEIRTGSSQALAPQVADVVHAGV
jgi:hypothetical protein